MYVMYYELLATATGEWHTHRVPITHARTKGRITPEEYCDAWREQLQVLVDRGEARNVRHGFAEVVDNDSPS